MSKEDKQKDSEKLEELVEKTFGKAASNILEIMSLYKDILQWDVDEQTAPLREELDKLRAENERLKKETEEWKLYGKSWSEKAASRLGEVISLDEQNKKLREALEKCKTILSCWDDTESVNKVVEIAKEALKGDDNV